MKNAFALAPLLTLGLWTVAAAPSNAEQPMASSAQCVTSVVTENEKFLVQDTVCAPGASSAMAKRPMRVLHIVKGARLTRTYEDGTKEKLTFKKGQTIILNIDKAYSYKNEGKKDFHVLVISTKN